MLCVWRGKADAFVFGVRRFSRRFVAISAITLRKGGMDVSEFESSKEEAVDAGEVPHEDLAKHKFFFANSEFLSLAQSLYQQRVIPLRLRKYVCEYASLSNAEVMDAWYTVGGDEEVKLNTSRNTLKLECSVTENWLRSISEEERKFFDQVGIYFLNETVNY